MEKPTIADTNCPACHKDAVMLELYGANGADLSFVSWCENGHVYVFDNDKGGKLVFAFGE